MSAAERWEGDHAVFVEIRRVIRDAARELHTRRHVTSPHGAFVIDCRLDELREIAERLAVVAYEKFGEPLVLDLVELEAKGDPS